MSKEAVSGFWKQMSEDEALRGELDALITSEGVLPVPEILALGERHGFSFTAGELESSLKAAAGGELSDAQLDSAAGGAYEFYVKMEGTTQGSLVEADYFKLKFGTRYGMITF